MKVLELTHDRLQAVREAFERNFAAGVDVGASVAIWQDEEKVLDLNHGWRDMGRRIPWTEDTLVLVWSATKGPASACVLRALDEAGLTLQTKIVEFWPEFGQAGKESLRVGDLLSHRAGLAALTDKNAQVLDHAGVIRALEAQVPLWQDDGHGYGPRTYGFLADEIVRRLSGETLGEYWRRHFANPLSLDLWIGLPEVEHPRVAQIMAARANCGDTEDAFTEAMATEGSVTREAFTTPAGMVSPSGMNTPAMRSASIPSFGGIASGSALAKFYAMLAAGGRWQGTRYVSERVVSWLSAPLSQGWDKTLQTETAFSAGFMMDPVENGQKKRSLFGASLRAFGHPGAGGSLAFADPENGLGFAYVMNQMESGVLPRSRAQALLQALYDLP